MKKLRLWTLSLIGAVLLVVLAGCPTSYVTTVYEPVYMSWDEFRSEAAVGQTEPRDIQDAGKIYVFDDLIFVSEPGKGIHVVDQRDPSDPVAVSFIEIPGTVDIAVLQEDGRTLLYADSFVDLLVFEITPDPQAFSSELVRRVEDVFPYNPNQAFIAEEEPVQIWDYDQSQGVIVDYEVREIREYVDRYDYAVGADGSGSGAEGGAGVAGSMARFMLYNDDDSDEWFLYAVDETSIMTFGLSNPELPSRQSRTDAGWGIETIFEYKDQLFLGSQSAMYVFGLENPASPAYISELQHWTANDPVVVGEVGPDEKDTAFVTLRSSDGWGVDALLAVDVDDVESPELLLEISLWNPHGLALFSFGDRDLLIVADGDAGLKVFDVGSVRDDALANAKRLEQILSLDNGTSTFDVIALAPNMLVVGPDGLYIYEYDEVPQTAGDPEPQLTLLGFLGLGGS
jgi:hypothetical protein